jgi:hypothetical protein
MQRYALEDDEAEVPIDYANMIAEQEHLQIQMNTDDELGHQTSEDLDQSCREIHGDLLQKTNAVVSLEAVVNYLDTMAKKNELNRASLVMANVATEELLCSAGFFPKEPTFSLESAGSEGRSSLMVSLEDLKSKIAEIFSYLKHRIVAVARHISKVAGQFARNMFRLKLKLSNLEQLLHQARATEPRFPSVKAESWCEYLCYTGKGFDRGLKNVLADSDRFVKGHTERASWMVGKYMGWFDANCTHANDDKIFNSLTYDPKDILLPGMHEFHRSVGFTEASGSNVFHRSQELPGGRAYYIQLDPQARVGLPALNALEAVGFKLNLYNPESYNMMKIKLSAISSMPLAIWLGIINPALGLAAVAGGVIGTLVTAHNSKFKNNGEQIRIDKNMLFEVLSMEEIRTVMSGVRKGMADLETWNLSVLQKPWKSHNLDLAVDEIMKNELSTSNMRVYCNALLSLMTELGSGVHTHTFRVYSAALNFVEKSLKQYQ